MRPRSPAWARLLAGWMLAAAWLAQRSETPPAPTPRHTLESAPLPAPPPTPRTWRRVPGVGRRRALDLARALWAAGVHDPRAFDPTRVPGIGAATATRIAAFLADTEGPYTAADHAASRIPDTPGPPADGGGRGPDPARPAGGPGQR